MKGNLWTLVVVACALALVAPAVNVAYVEEAPQGFDASEETTVDYNQNYTLETNDPIAYESLTATLDDGTELTEGSDYLFENSTGTLDWQDTSTTTDGDAVTVEYSFEDRSETTETQANLLRPLATVIGLLFLVVAIATGLKVAFGGF